MHTHEMFDGRLQIYKRANSRVWQCAARVGESRFRQTTGEADLDRAKDIAEEWYLDLRGKTRRGEIVKKERTFGEAWELYLKDVRVLAIGVRTPKYVEVMEQRVRRNVLPFFGDKPLSQINRGLVQAYRVKRGEASLAARGKPPARSTMLQEIVHIRQVLKHAEGLGWIPFVPSLSTPYLTQGKKGRRAWFSPDEYKQLREATRRRITEGKRPGWTSRYEDLHYLVLFIANSGLRPDEAINWLEFRDVSVVKDVSTKSTILHIDVRGKTGVGLCVSLPGAVYPFEQLKAKRIEALGLKGHDEDEINKKIATFHVFPQYDRATFNEILKEEGLKEDRDGRPRTLYSLRHTYISNRLIEGANHYQLANNCRTSVQMIEEFYAAHIKELRDVSAINTVRRRPTRPSKKQANSEQQSGVETEESTLVA